MTTESIVESHWCKESDGKIICIEIDLFGNSYCSYCHQRVIYPIDKNVFKFVKLKKENA